MCGILLGRVGPYATIERAMCECATGSVLPYACTCIHILLYNS